MEVETRLGAAAERLTAAERRIADAILADPAAIGFGTVAQLASAAGVGAATVVRLCSKLGYDGFGGLQASVQQDLAGRLQLAAQRIRAPAGADETLRERQRRVAAANLSGTLDAVDVETLAAAVELLADPARTVLVVSGAASAGVAHQLVVDLGQLRDGVAALDGNAVENLRRLAVAADDAVVVAVDLPRYDRWVLDLIDVVRRRRLATIAVTDSVISPLAVDAAAVLTVRAEAAGPFESHVGTLALFDLLVASVAARRRSAAAKRLEAIEREWSRHGALTD